MVVEISHVEGWTRKIQFRDRGVTHAIFIENGNKALHSINLFLDLVSHDLYSLLGWDFFVAIKNLIVMYKFGNKIFLYPKLAQMSNFYEMENPCNN